jgi:uncharacterized protein YidB (DUF937 family)
MGLLDDLLGGLAGAGGGGGMGGAGMGGANMGGGAMGGGLGAGLGGRGGAGGGGMQRMLVQAVIALVLAKAAGGAMRGRGGGGLGAAPGAGGGMGLDDLLGGLLGGGGAGGLGGLGGLARGMGANMGGGGGLGGAGAMGGLGGLGGLLAGLGGAGALGPMLDAFRQHGQSDAVDSWVSTGANRPVGAGDVEQVFGRDAIESIARQLGIAPDEAAQGVAQVLPDVVDHLTPGGQVPSAERQASSLEELARRLGPR